MPQCEHEIQDAQARERRIQALMEDGGQSREQAQVIDDMSLEAVNAALEAMDGVVKECAPGQQSFVHMQALLMLEANVSEVIKILLGGGPTFIILRRGEG